MAVVYAINGTPTTVAPFKQTIIDYRMGDDHTGAPVIGGFRSIRLDFDVGNYANATEWITQCNTGTSLTSLTVLTLPGSNFTDLSGVFLQLERPAFEAGHVGPFSIIVNRCTF